MRELIDTGGDLKYWFSGGRNELLKRFEINWNVNKVEHKYHILNICRKYHMVKDYKKLCKPNQVFTTYLGN